MLSCCHNVMHDRISNMIEELDLLEYKKTLLKNRFLDQVVLYDKKAKAAEFFYQLYFLYNKWIIPIMMKKMKIFKE